jgi:hypothetical protein
MILRCCTALEGLPCSTARDPTSSVSVSVAAPRTRTTVAHVADQVGLREDAAMTGKHFRQGMHGLAIRLTAALEASGPLGDSLTKGELREEEIIDAMRPHIPTRYDLVKGVVVTADGQESDPQDIILVDSFTMPPILGRGTTKAVPVECASGNWVHQSPVRARRRDMVMIMEM